MAIRASYKNRYVAVFADALVRVYGNTLRENDVDIEMATAIYKKLGREFHKMNDVAFARWKKNTRLS